MATHSYVQSVEDRQPVYHMRACPTRESELDSASTRPNLTNLNGLSVLHRGACWHERLLSWFRDPQLGMGAVCFKRCRLLQAARGRARKTAFVIACTVTSSLATGTGSADEAPTGEQS